MLEEFKKFAMRGNVIELAIGMIIGAAFSKVVTSLVSDLVMPPIGYLLGGIDFRSLSWVIQQASDGQPLVEIRYGAFINTIVDFLIIAWSVFLMIKTIRHIPGGSRLSITSKRSCPECVMEIPLTAKKCGYCGSVIE